MLVVLNILEDGEEEVLDQEIHRLVVGFEKGRSKMYLKIKWSRKTSRILDEDVDKMWNEMANCIERLKTYLGNLKDVGDRLRRLGGGLGRFK